MADLDKAIWAEAKQHITEEMAMHVARQAHQDPILYGYDADLDRLHAWFSVNRANAVSLAVSSDMEVEFDDDTGEVIGFTIDRYREQVLARMSWVDRLRWKRRGVGILTHDIPMVPVRDFARLAHVPQRLAVQSGRLALPASLPAD